MYNREQLKRIIVDQRGLIQKKQVGVEREKLNVFAKKKDLPHVVVITGLRRVGKSTLLRQIIKKYYSDKNYYFINFEDERLLNFDPKKFSMIYEAMVELYGEQKVFFIDEIQNIKNFEIFIRRFYEQGFKFIITGSNANLLSREIGTKLTGRHINISLKPFSFAEYLVLKNQKISRESIYRTETIAKIKKHFDNYLLIGGMPEYLLYDDPEILGRTYDDIVMKDIAVRYSVENLLEMRELFQYIISNYANKFSYTSLKKAFNFGSVHTVKKYISFLEETYFISLANKFDYSIKKQLANEKKAYVLDNGFIPQISNKLTKDNGWLLENLVFNKLSELGHVFYFNFSGECDFVLQEKQKITMAVQVCWELNNKNEEREIAGLLKAMDEFNLKEGLIITSNQEEEKRDNKSFIRIVPAWKWLLNN